MANPDLIETGTQGPDRLRGADGNDRFEALGGNDTIWAGFGDDLVLGGAGQDVFVFVGGHDTLDGGDGMDCLLYEGGTRLKIDLNLTTAQALDVGSVSVSGIEQLRYTGADGNVVIGTVADNALMAMGATDDLQIGLGGNDTLLGGGGDDTLIGGAGDDFIAKTDGWGGLHGGCGNDTLTAGSGGSRMVGGTGQDRLVGGAGRDILWGGDGPGSAGDGSADLFEFAATDLGVGADRDVIRDFEQGLDRVMLFGGLDFLGDAPFDGTGPALRAVVINGNTLLEIDSNGDGQTDGQILLNGAFALTADDFIL